MLKIWIAYFAVYQKQLLVQISFYGLIESVTHNLYLKKKKKGKLLSPSTTNSDSAIQTGFNAVISIDLTHSSLIFVDIS